MNMNEVRTQARERMGKRCRVCPVCDGRACRSEVPGMGGLGTGASFTANVAALAGVKLRMRLVHSVTDPDTSVEVLGRKLSIPVLAAPIGGVSYNMDGAVSEQEYITAKVAACAEFGTLCCVGDGVPPEIHQCAYRAISEAGGAGIPFIKPWEDEEFYQKMDKAQATGASIMGMDIDAAGLITLRMQGRPVSPKPPEKLAEIVRRWGGPFILKGVMTAEDALMAADAGVSAIVVSNHGGRVLDHTPGTAEVLPAIAKAVAGRMEVLVDGGVRTGADVLKMLALGADAVMIGRPFSVASVGGGQEGVTAYLNQLSLELRQAMVMTGTPGAAQASSSLIHHSDRPGA